ncbi:MAG: aminotransferase class V-fold PLP-dependent enzyme [Pseudonocardiaceae bacterium]
MTDNTLMEHVRTLMEHVRGLHDPLVEGGVLDQSHANRLHEDLQRFFKRLADPKESAEEYWAEFQKEFGFAYADPKLIPMNAANLCPEPLALLEWANALRLAYNTNVAQQIRMAHGLRVEQITRARRLLASSLGLPENTSDLVMVRNASEGNNAINCGYRNWAKTDNVVLWEYNHPTNLDAWNMRSQWNGKEQPLFQIKIVTLGDVEKPDPKDAATEIAKRFIGQIDASTRFVSFSEISNVTGIRIPDAAIDAIWQHVKEQKDCHLHIDATMAWGARDVSRLIGRCHSFVSSAHKWFLGPKETGILYMSQEKAKNFEPSIFAYNYEIFFNDLDHTKRNGALRFEQLGQRDDVQLITLAKTELMWEAIKRSGRKPYERVRELADRLKDRLGKATPPWEFVTPKSSELSWGVVFVRAPWLPADKQDSSPSLPTTSLYDWIYEKKRIAGSMHNDADASDPDKTLKETFRLCPHIYNTIEDVDNAVKSMNEWRDTKGA